MKTTKVAKVVFAVIWTGILIAAACLIGKGSNILDISIGSFVKETFCLDFIKEKKALFAYSQYPFVSTAWKEWPLLRATEWENISQEVLLEYREGDQEIDYSLISESLEYPIITGESYYETETKDKEDQDAGLAENKKKMEELKNSLDAEYLLQNFYVVDGTTSAETDIFNVKKMLSKDFHIEKKEGPQILIYHTHGATESFSDSEKGNKDESIIGVGSYLKEILEEEYGYEVLHDETAYDMINGSTDRNKAYNQSLEGVQAALKKYPSIQVAIDLHRDGVAGKDKKLTVVNGKKTAKIMFFNGLSRNKNGPIDYLYNKNLSGNLSFSLQLKLKAMEKYPYLTTPNYLKGYRYNLHLLERSLLIELGNQNNTFQEAKNAMEPLADILNQVLE